MFHFPRVPRRKPGVQDWVPAFAGTQGHPPGRSRIRLAMMPSWISLVPPSIELALVRSHSRAALPLFERSLSHSSAFEPPAATTSSWRALLSSVPAYFIIEGWAGCAIPALSSSMNRSDIARHGPVRRRCDGLSGDVGAKHGIVGQDVRERLAEAPR